MSNSDIVLVTGGTGYVATFCIARLLTDGYTVRTTVRRLERAADVRAAVEKFAPGLASGIEFVECDLVKDAGWSDAVAGCRYVLHVASPFPTTAPKNDEELVGPARGGVLRVLEAARDAGVARVVMTSSLAAVSYGHARTAQVCTEADWSDPTNLSDTNAYERSKAIAERAAWDWIAREGGSLQFVTVNPGAILGPVFGKDVSASITIVSSLLNGTIPGNPRFGWPLVDVRDVADLHVRAMLAPQAAGQRYIAAGPFFWISDVAEVLRSRLPRLAERVPKRTLPSWLVRLSGRFDPVVRYHLFELDKYRPVSADKAKTELGWAPRENAEAIVATAESLVRERLVTV